MTAPVRLSGAPALAAAVPALLGFHPTPGDGVLIIVAGRKVELTARFDCDPATLDGMAPQLFAAYRQVADASAAHLLVYGPDPSLLLDAGNALILAGIPLRELLRVHDGTVFDLHGWSEPLPEDLHVRPALIMATGGVVRSSREELVALFDTPAPPTAESSALAAALAEIGTRDARLAALADLSAEELAAELDLAIATARTGLAHDAACTYAAIVAYLLGDGGIANVALGHVRGDYSLARLIAAALQATLPPSVLRDMLRASA